MKKLIFIAFLFLFSFSLLAQYEKPYFMSDSYKEKLLSAVFDLYALGEKSKDTKEFFEAKKRLEKILDETYRTYGRLYGLDMRVASAIPVAFGVFALVANEGVLSNSVMRSFVWPFFIEWATSHYRDVYYREGRDVAIGEIIDAVRSMGAIAHPLNPERLAQNTIEKNCQILSLAIPFYLRVLIETRYFRAIGHATDFLIPRSILQVIAAYMGVCPSQSAQNIAQNIVNHPILEGSVERYNEAIRQGTTRHHPWLLELSPQAIRYIAEYADLYSTTAVVNHVSRNFQFSSLDEKQLLTNDNPLDRIFFSFNEIMSIHPILEYNDYRHIFYIIDDIFGNIHTTQKPFSMERIKENKENIQIQLEWLREWLMKIEGADYHLQQSLRDRWNKLIKKMKSDALLFNEMTTASQQEIDTRAQEFDLLIAELEQSLFGPMGVIQPIEHWNLMTHLISRQ